MDKDLESRWQEAARQKNFTPDQLRAMVQEMEKGLSIPHNWNQRVEASIRKERMEVEERYGIRLGHTEIRCSSCEGSWGFGRHVCQDIRLKQLNEAKKTSSPKTPELCFKVKRLGTEKVATMLYEEKNGVVVREVTEEAVRGWIKRGNIPVEYQEAVGAL